MKTARQLGYDVLLQVRRGGGYSNLTFDRMARTAGMERRESAFAAALVYGVLERALGLDHILEGYVRRGVKSLEPEVHIILQMGLYQLLYLDSVPDRAAVDESVKLTSYARKTSAKGLVNAVLRGFLRDGKQIHLPAVEEDPVGYYSLQYSLPAWIFSLWRDQYGMETAVRLAASSVEPPPLYIRVNTLKISADALIRRLREHGMEVQPQGALPNCLILHGAGSLEQCPEFREGLFYVQDFASQLCAAALDAQPGQLVYDLCAAPGSKSFTIAQGMRGRGKIRAFDLHPHKVRLIEQGASRLRIEILEAAVRDAVASRGDLPLADRVLCDVPCSGLGVLRRKPEIKQKQGEELESLPELQSSILANASTLVKPGGILLYSTCTLNQRENEAVVERFLKENNAFLPLHFHEKIDIIKDNDSFGTTLFPFEFGSDGFFFAGFCRKE